jgi:hypothetical protein
MNVQLFFAPARGGKTAHAISHIRRLRASAPLAPVWVVLPNFPQVAGFRRRPGPSFLNVGRRVAVAALDTAPECGKIQVLNFNP